LNQNHDSSSDSSSPRTGRLPAPAVVLAVYLGLTAPLIPLGGIDGPRLALLGLHLATLVPLLTLHRWGGRGRIRRVVADLAPLLLVGTLYAELPFLMEGMPGPVRYHDLLIGAWEEAIFGTQPAFTWAGAWPFTPLSELLHACYFSYYAMIYAPPLMLYVGVTRVRGDRRRAYEETVLALVLAFLACFVVFIVLPVQGPRYLGVPPGVPDGPVRRLVLLVLESASSRGAAFPSSHVSVAVAQALLALRFQPRVGRWTAAVAVGLAAGAVYGGFHYGIDALSGAAVGVLAAAAACPLRRGLQGSVSGFTSSPETA
jgi:membrane-associated phospholipid phosphatase